MDDGSELTSSFSSHGTDVHTLFPLSTSARSQTATSPAYWPNSLTWVSSSAVHLFTISSRVLPRSIDGAGTDIWVDVVPAGVVVVGTLVDGFSVGKTSA